MSFSYMIYLYNCKTQTIINSKIRYFENYDILDFYLFLKKSLFRVFIPTVKVCTMSSRTPIYIYIYIHVFMLPNMLFTYNCLALTWHSANQSLFVRVNMAHFHACSGKKVYISAEDQYPFSLTMNQNWRYFLFLHSSANIK